MVSRLCEPIEGLDAACIAQCLGEQFALVDCLKVGEREREREKRALVNLLKLVNHAEIPGPQIRVGISPQCLLYTNTRFTPPHRGHLGGFINQP